jgi:hypothetical protein
MKKMTPRGGEEQELDAIEGTAIMRTAMEGKGGMFYVLLKSGCEYVDKCIMRTSTLS